MSKQKKTCIQKIIKKLSVIFFPQTALESDYAKTITVLYGTTVVTFFVGPMAFALSLILCIDQNVKENRLHPNLQCTCAVITVPSLLGLILVYYLGRLLYKKGIPLYAAEVKMYKALASSLNKAEEAAELLTDREWRGFKYVAANGQFFRRAEKTRILLQEWNKAPREICSLVLNFL